MNNYRCFADNGWRCRALVKKMCEYGDCPFYKTAQRIHNENKRSEARIRALYGMSPSEFIHSKYKENT